MLGVLFVALATPEPSPFPPLKTITHVRSSPFCTTLRERVGPAIKALAYNNIVIGETKSLFLKMARDKVSSARPNMVMDMNMQRLDPLISTMADNLAVSQAKLNDAVHFPTQPRTEEERRLAEIQKALRAIVDRQNEALNILSGTFFSYNGNRLMGHGDGMPKGDGTGVQVDDPNQETPIVLPPIRHSAEASPAPNASSSPGPASQRTPQAVDMGLVGKTKFASLFNSLTTYQLQEQPLESKAAKIILESAAQCNGQ
jgi:hypothetical protein